MLWCSAGWSRRSPGQRERDARSSCYARSAAGSGRGCRRRGGAEGGATAAGGTEARVTPAAAALRSLRGDLELIPAEGGWRLKGYGCPLSAVTAGRPEVCALAQALVEEITGRPVTECCDRGTRPRCGFQVAAP